MGLDFIHYYISIFSHYYISIFSQIHYYISIFSHIQQHRCGFWLIFTYRNAHTTKIKSKGKIIKKITQQE